MLAPELIRIKEKPLANWVTAAKVNAIRGEFMRQCDALDGLADGIINNYMACRAIFDVTQGKRGRHPWTAKRCPGNIDPNPADTTANACLTDGQMATLEFTYSRYAFATPLAHGTKTFGMWVPNTDPSGSGLIATTRFKGQEGATETSANHSHLGVLGVTGFLMKNVTANPLDYVEGGALNRRREELAHARLDKPRPACVREARRQDDRHDRHQRHAGFARRAARLLRGRAGQDGAPCRRSVRAPSSCRRPATASAARATPSMAPERRSRPRRYRISMIGTRCCSTGWNADRTAHVGGGHRGERSLPLCSYPSYPRYVSGPANAASSYRCSQ